MKSDATLRDVGLLLARLGLGASIAAHGAQKMFGAFGGPGIKGAGAMMTSLGLAPGERYARAAAAAELGAGALMILGAGGPAGPAALLSTMIVAAETVHRKNGFFAQNQGFELNSAYALGALLLATSGNGRFSLDAIAGIDRRVGATAGWLALGIAAGASYLMLARRSVAPAEPRHIRVETGTAEPASSRP